MNQSTSVNIGFFSQKYPFLAASWSGGFAIFFYLAPARCGQLWGEPICTAPWARLHLLQHLHSALLPSCQCWWWVRKVDVCPSALDREHQAGFRQAGRGRRDCPVRQHPGTGQCWTRNSYARRKGKKSKFTSHPRSGAGRTMFGVVVQLWSFLFSRGQEL